MICLGHERPDLGGTLLLPGEITHYLEMIVYQVEGLIKETYRNFKILFKTKSHIFELTSKLFFFMPMPLNVELLDAVVLGCKEPVGDDGVKA